MIEEIDASQSKVLKTKTSKDISPKVAELENKLIVSKPLTT